MQFKKFNKINLIFIFSLMVVLAIGGLSYFVNERDQAYNSLVTHTDEVLNAAKTMLSLFQDVESGMRGYVITGKNEFLEPHAYAVEHIAPNLKHIEDLTQDNPRQQMRVGKLKMLGEQLEDRSSQLHKARDTNGLRAAANLVLDGNGKKIMDQIRATIKDMEDEEHNLLISRTADARKSSNAMSLVSVSGSILAVIFIFIAMVILNRQLRDVQRAEFKVHKLNGQLTDKLVELETSNRELETFSYSVSHDLRAPLRTMVGFSSIILEDHGDALNAEVKENLSRVTVAAKKMGQLIDGLLDLSRLSRKEILTEDVNLSAFAQDIFKELQESNPDRKANLAVARDIHVRGDSRLLLAALSNLLSNAWKFTKNRSVAQIEFGVQREGQAKIYFVRDNGAGFDMKYVNKLFGIFQRLHTVKEFEGTGIGLATVQRIIQRHGGKIWAESEVDKGTTFYFTV